MYVLQEYWAGYHVIVYMVATDTIIPVPPTQSDGDNKLFICNDLSFVHSTASLFAVTIRSFFPITSHVSHCVLSCNQVMSVHDLKAYGRMELELHTFLISVINEGQQQLLCCSVCALRDIETLVHQQMRNFTVPVFFPFFSSCMFWHRHLQGTYAKISFKRSCEGCCLSTQLSTSTHHMGTETNLDQERNVCKQLIGMETCTSFNL